MHVLHLNVFLHSLGWQKLYIIESHFEMLIMEICFLRLELFISNPIENGLLSNVNIHEYHLTAQSYMYFI